MNEFTESFSEVLWKAYELSCALVDAGSQDELVWVYYDGHRQKSILDRIEGKCSLQASLDFDVAAAEQEVIADVEKFKSMLQEATK